MAVHNLDFGAQVAAWAGATVEDITKVFHVSTITAVEEMQRIGPSTAFPGGQGGRMPVDTGWLRASIRVSLGAMPTIDPSSYPPIDAGENSIPYNKGAVDSAINAAPLGSKISIGYTAAYAGLQEYGTAKSNARRFVGVAAIMWPSIVQKAIERAKKS